jgi:hypothetical protein
MLIFMVQIARDLNTRIKKSVVKTALEPAKKKFLLYYPWSKQQIVLISRTGFSPVSMRG